MNGSSPQGPGRDEAACAFSLLALLVAMGCASPKDAGKVMLPGVAYHLQEFQEPRLNRVHVMRVDLSNSRIKPTVVIAVDPDGDGPAETSLTHPLKLAEGPSVLAFVNTNPWDSFPDATGKKNRHWFAGQPVDIEGLAISDGHTRSAASPNPASVWFDESGNVFLGAAPVNVTIAEGTNGFQKIVSEGALVVPEGGTVHPRTAIGVGPHGHVLFLVVVDGRQKQFSEGMNLYELGQVMIGLGCWTATNMDGGGSSIMGMRREDGQLHIMNSPSDRHRGKSSIRPLPMILTIRRCAP